MNGNDSQQGDRDRRAKRLLADIRSDDPERRTQAWLRAGQVGAEALRPLAKLVAEGELEVRRAAKRAMWKIVRDAGNPTASQASKQGVAARLVELLDDQQPDAVRREVLWMLSEIGGDEAVEPVARLLKCRPLREDARMVLDRLPGQKSLAALRRGLEQAPDDFKPHLAQSLRHRGVVVPGLPCRKMVPTRKTGVTRPAGA